MKKKILVVGPVLTRSGYGEQSRFALRALRTREEDFDIYIVPTSWGSTGWLVDVNEERAWIDQRIKETQIYNSQGGRYDATIQVDVPWSPPPPGSKEGGGWRQLSNHDIGFTAGIETTKVSPQWIQSAAQMKKIIVVSNHSKEVFNNTEYEGKSDRGEVVNLKNQTPIDVVGFPFRKQEPTIPEIDLEYDFNFLTIAQWGPRKNLENTLRWFIEEFHNRPVGYIIKTSFMKNCLMDRNRVYAMVKNIYDQYEDTKCKIYLLHGDLSDSEVAGLYKHPKIKVYLSLTHGEGFGLPIFDAVCFGLPVVTSGWSGQMDYLTAPKRNKPSRKRGHFAKVDFSLAPIQREAVWDGILQKDSLWCYPSPGSAKMRMRQAYESYEKHIARANVLKKHILKEFDQEVMYKKFLAALELDIIETPEDNFQEVIVL